MGVLTPTLLNTFGMNCSADSKPSSVLDPTNASLAEYTQIPTDTFENLLESIPRKVQAVISAKKEHKLMSISFGIGCSISSYRCDG